MTFCAICFCAIAIVALTINEHARLYKENARSDLSALSQNTAEELVQYLAFGTVDDLALTTYLLKFERYEHIKTAQIYDIDSKLASQFVNPQIYRHIGQHPPKLKKEEIKPGLWEVDEQLISILIIGDTKLLLGYLVIILDVGEQLKQSENAFYFQLFPMVILVLLVTLFLVHRLQSSLIKPLVDLNAVVDMVHKTSNYSLRFRSVGNDEISQLGENLNKMVSRISQQNAENKAYNNELKAQQHSLENLANFDQLTKLPNRKLFQELLQQQLVEVKKKNSELAVIFIDLDDFKTVNDTLGHYTGDLLLTAVSQRLKRQIRDGDILARLGGDEFVIVVTQLAYQVEAVEVAERILDAFKKEFDLDKWQVSSGLSIGIAYSSDSHGNLQSLISNADLAMYRAKRSGRGRYAVYEDEMQSYQHRRLQIVTQLGKALSEDEFELYYQPKVCPERGVIALEALIRWPSSFDGMISPAEFIPIAEHCCKVHDITRWVLATGFRHVELINQALGTDIQVSFNISAFDIAKEGFVEYIKELIECEGIDAKLIEFEVTESAYIENFELASKFFEAIESLNCQIALDDFGTGYSSLSYLTQIKAHTLKIDQQFIRKMFESESERLIVDAIISLAKNLKLNVCAEGVETKAQYDYLSARGCELIQGFYFSKAVPFSQVVATIKRINQSYPSRTMVE